jgi:site-specific recombinase XerD
MNNTPATAARVTVPTASGAADLQRAAELAGASRSEATVRAYAADARAFQAYAAAAGMDPTTPQAVVACIAAMVDDGRPWSTIQRRLAGVRAWLASVGAADAAEHPAVAAVVAGARRTVGVATRNERDPLLVDDLARMVAALGDCAAGDRDRALLLVGFGAGLRRSELVALDVADLRFDARGVALTIRRSKTDQTGAGRVVALPYGRAATCPVRALRAWLDRSGTTAGPVFRSVSRAQRIGAERLTDRAVALVVKSVAERAGLDPARLAGHSLRAGLVTSAVMAGASSSEVMRQTGHRSEAMVRRYTRIADAYANNVAGRLL